MPGDGSGHDLASNTGFLLRRAHQAHTAAWQRYVSREISSVQFGLLTVLRRYPGASQRELCDHLDLDRSTVTDVVARLERRGLIARIRDVQDRRRNVLELSSAGQAALDELAHSNVMMEQALTGNLSAVEIALLRDLLLRVILS